MASPSLQRHRPSWVGGRDRALGGIFVAIDYTRRPKPSAPPPPTPIPGTRDGGIDFRRPQKGSTAVAESPVPAPPRTAGPRPESLITASHRELGALREVIGQDEQTCRQLARSVPETIQRSWPAIENDQSRLLDRRRVETQAAADANQRLISAFSRRFGRDPQARSGSGAPAKAAPWTRQALALAGQLETTKVPLFREKRRQQEADFVGQASEILGRYPSVKARIVAEHVDGLTDLYARAHERMTTEGLRSAVTSASALRGRLGDGLSRISGIAPMWSRVGDLASGISVASRR